ncbi:hypothetical protein LK10_15745, partial [Sinomonas humi]
MTSGPASFNSSSNSTSDSAPSADSESRLYGGGVNGAGPLAGELSPMLLPVVPAALDRRSEDRADPAFLASIVHEQGTMALLLAQHRAAMEGERLVLLPAAELPQEWLDGLVVYLGRVPEVHHKS